MTRYLKSVWQCRYFWMSLVRMDLRTRYRRSILGLGWSLLNPIAMTVTLCVVFHTIFQVGIREYAPYLICGLVAWNFILTVTLQGCQSFFQAESYMRQHPAPLAIYPLRTALGGSIHFLFALAVVLALTFAFKGFAHPLALFSLIPALILLFLFAWSLAVLAGCANVHFQDTQHLAEVGFQILFYATPIMYQMKDLHSEKLSRLVGLNPLLYVLKLLRDPILDGQIPSWNTYAIASGVIAATVLAAGITLTRLQSRLIFHL
jgi:ABC-type polysaccharide/polyol phosphate export permease